MAFLFIGGSQRSGTTLLQQVICAAPAATPQLAEASYLRMLMQAYQKAKQDFNHDTGSYFSTPEDFRHFHAGLVYAFLHRTLAQYPDASTLVLKEPHLTRFFPELFVLVPEAMFVLVMRDPRDVIASMISVGERMRELGQQHFFQQRDIGQLSNLLKSFYAPTLNNHDQAFRKRALTIRYEDLVNNSAEVIARIAGFSGLDIPVDRATTAVAPVGADSEQPRYKPWYTDNSGKPVNASSIGKYRSVLTAEEIAAVDQHCADILGLFKYT